MKTVIHLTSREPADVGHAMRSATLLGGHDELEHEAVTLLVHREGIRIVTPDSEHAEGIAELLDAGVDVTAGASCLAARGLPETALPGVEIVPSGVSELVRLQAEGYHYVKVP